MCSVKRLTSSVPAFAVRRTCRGPNILALMAKSAGALSDAETARFAKIILPRVIVRAAGLLVEQSAQPGLSQGLRVGKRGGLFQRKPNLRIGGEIDAAALLARARVGDDLTRRVVAEIGR